MTISIVGSRRYVGCLDVVSFYDSARQDRMYFRVECEGKILANYLPYPEDAEKQAWAIYAGGTCRTCTPTTPPPPPPPQTISCFSLMEPLIMTKYRAQYTTIKSGRPPDLGDVEWCCANGINTEAKLRVFLKIDVPPCTPNWVCEQPLNGYEKDGCGNRRANAACNPAPPPCTPNWVCETPLNGYEKDGCGNRRAATRCNPTTPPPVPPVTPIDSRLIIAALVIIIVLYLIFSEK